MKRAILSDIHGNLEALQAVLADVAAQGVDQVFCLGDIIGYGPNPRQCIDLVMDFEVCILGNHDQGALFDPEGFSSGAEKALFWTRRQLESLEDGPEQTRRRWNFLSELPRNHRLEGLLFVHGSARSPLNEYVFPEDVYNPRKMERIFSVIDGCCFQGHTHVPGVFTQDGRFLSPREIEFVYRLDDRKTMVNVGSVGQPRDNDCRACYVILEDRAVTFRRVEYPLQETVRKIYEIAELDNFLGDRLIEGR